ncbi:neurogenic locus notch homolog protein 3-like [Pristis pectinata]|uniref:neurogenic locus notch homolog protein 3-like n=1 Tax=Pristis pectinata TaxID=685728 RepID=UPI00223D43F7|nr:neurogenic locus notch homolog protein 3-like [Pristis pectinata]
MEMLLDLIRQRMFAHQDIIVLQDQRLPHPVRQEPLLVQLVTQMSLTVIYVLLDFTVLDLQILMRAKSVRLGITVPVANQNQLQQGSFVQLITTVPLAVQIQNHVLPGSIRIRLDKYIASHAHLESIVVHCICLDNTMKISQAQSSPLTVQLAITAFKESRLSSYSGLCDPGCVCLLQSTTPCPSDNITGYLCPPGHYCPQGSGYGIRCPAGTFGPQGGLSSVTECSPCTPGLYCDVEGLASPSGPCFPGHYCVLGARTGNPFGDQTGDKCPPGYFCPSGTDSPKPCPPGTYQPLLGMVSRSECLPCTGGKYCEGQGQSNVSGDCSAGFYCISGSSSAFPLDGTTGAPCPLGHYCPASSSHPLACRNGK